MKGFGQELGPDAIAALLKREAKPVFLLGAGASLRSGIPLTDTLVDSIARFSFCKAHNRDPVDPTLMPSDWLRWLERQSWFKGDMPKSGLYPLAVEHLLQPQSNRREFFARILKPDVPPSEGYRRLATLLSRNAVKTILTTNFDDLVVRTAKSTPTIPHIQEFSAPGNLDAFSTAPAFPQLLYLHGSVHQYTDKNSLEQIELLHEAWLPILEPLLRDHAMVVVGYRGMEASVMRHLLLGQAERCRLYKEGIYWCHLPSANPLQESPYVAELSRTIGTNLQLVEIEGFDELMTVLEASYEPAAKEVWHVLAASGPAAHGVFAHDLLPSAIEISDLSEALLRVKLQEYASGLRLPNPDLSNSTKLAEVLVSRSLALAAGGTSKPTLGGQLLFAKSPSSQLQQARILVHVSGPAHWVSEVLELSNYSGAGEVSETAEIVGDLWTQHDKASGLLSRVNRPFRMKGAISHSAHPYPPLALKELLTNLLAHRDYAITSPASMFISPEKITFENPGGLVEIVRSEIENEAIQDVIGMGSRPVKGYRNPVVSDFFFFAGAMDKEGSGLPDVMREAANNLNSVEFGPTESNSAFVATIYCRPEALTVDEKTNTAKASQAELRYSPNLLRIVAWPEHVRKVGTIAGKKELTEARLAGAPPFGVSREWLWTFNGLRGPLHPALEQISIDEERHVVPNSEFLDSSDSWGTVPRVLNAALTGHLRGLGMELKAEGPRLRAYYPCAEDGGAREISYRSAFKQAKRTVAKPITSRTTGKLIYWEHKAVSLRFERFGNTWAMSLLPGYVFTLDGISKPIASERIGPLTTRRASRDYNPTVLHDLVFWARMISDGADTEFQIALDEGDGAPSILVAGMMPTFVFQDVADAAAATNAGGGEVIDAELTALQDEIEQEINEAADDETADQ